ncbi:MAG: hypothetical protein J1G06_04300 [Oscillospiraceae bacterium]|nr:hypothetical protein [Oscillospiraceae bacterium]
MNSALYSLFISLALRMTVVTAFVMLIKLVFRNKLSAATHCAIWVILFAQSVFCLGNIKIPARTSIYNVVSESVIVNSPSGVVQEAAASVDIRNVIALVYFLGIAVCAIWYLSVFMIHRIKVKRSETVTDAEALNILRDVKFKLGITNPIVLKRGSYAHTLLNTVVLPEGYGAEEQRQILLHELCHHKHKDNMKLWAAVVVICLNWFNPMVWIAFRRFRRDIEMYCDDSVLKLTDSKKEYARVLVKTATDHIRFVPGVVGAANGTHEVAKRVKRIAAWKKKKPVWLIIAMLSSICVSCLCLTDAVSIAVATKAAEITATPEPVDVIPAITELVKPTAEPEIITNEPTVAPLRATASPKTPKQANTSVQQPVVSEAQPQPAEEQVSEPQPKEEQVSVPTPESEIVTRREVSANGSKETYSREDGKTVVLQYDGDNLQTGYIIDGE